ncbi:MAG: hypothetical protein KDA92_15900, partial [Planctomycetales bacterium]|nr:hypothetical protein [Planctomycetales bacterium]
MRLQLRRVSILAASATYVLTRRRASLTVICSILLVANAAAQSGNPLRPQMDSQPIPTGGVTVAAGIAEITTHPIVKPSMQADLTLPPASAVESAHEPASTAAEEKKSETPPPTVSPETPTSPDVSKAITLERVAELAKAARESALSDELKADLAKRYQAATESLQGVDECLRKVAQYEQDMTDSGERIETARQALTATMPEAAAVDAKLSLRELESLLDEAKQKQTAAATKLSEREAELKNRAERKADWIKKVDETRKRITQIEQELLVAPPAGEAPELSLAKRTELSARNRLLTVQADLYQAEIRRTDKLAELFPLQRDLAKREANLADKVVTQLSALVDTARQVESERQAVEARRQANFADPAIRDLAVTNADLAEKRQVIAEKISQVTAEIQEITQQLSTLNGDFQRAQDKVDKAGHTAIVGLMLRRQYDKLPSLRRSEQRLHRIEQELPVASLERL